MSELEATNAVEPEEFTDELSDEALDRLNRPEICCCKQSAGSCSNRGG